jgi:hypothetical protein
MSGSGGFKQRNKKLKRKRRQAKKAGAENVARVRAMFEKKGHTWNPAANSVQQQAMNHAGRRVAVGPSSRSR